MKNIKEAWETIKESIESDPEYAWAVHCNLAMPIYDEGCDIKIANKIAARIIRHWFNYDMNNNKFYQNRMIDFDEDDGSLLFWYDRNNWKFSLNEFI